MTKRATPPKAASVDLADIEIALMDIGLSKENAVPFRNATRRLQKLLHDECERAYNQGRIDGQGDCK